MASVYYDRLKSFEKILATKIPEFNIKFKNESLLMKIIGTIFFLFNSRFMTGFTTTLGYTIYFPSSEQLETANGNNALVTMAHEFRHMIDTQRKGRLLFSLSYLFPQVLAPLMLLFAFISLPLAIGLFVLFLLPLPAYWRMKTELNGYIMSLFSVNEILKEINISETDRKDQLSLLLPKMNHHFISLEYYLMWYFGVKEQLERAVEKIISEEIKNEDVIYSEIAQALNDSRR